MSESIFAVGQRWISNSEAELGLGIVKEVNGRRVVISFPAASEDRTYAADNAPLSRVIYPIGDTVKTEEGDSFTITAQHDLNNCIVYHGLDALDKEISFHELDLSSHVQFSQPQDRLFAGQIDKNRQFELRTEALSHQHRLEQSSVFGLMGPRVQLLPHQIYIAHQVAQRFAPRVLLADEVGLGKTIEAGLIAHQQLLTGRAQRILVIVPDSLLHQWLVELLRRFNLHFTIMDYERFDAITEADEGNPFDSAQLVLCQLSMLADQDNPDIYSQACAADWDLMIVDEAHHLQWSEQQVSKEYHCIEGLAREVAGLLLLTATPEQLGIESHFARLRLLDPERYYDLAIFKEQEATYQPVSALVSALINCETSSESSDLAADIEAYLGADTVTILEKSDDFDAEKQRVIDALLDLHGTGRLLFRNTREVVTGFPQRHLHPHNLTAPDIYNDQALNGEPLALLQAERLLGDDWLSHDPRVTWLVDWLAEHRQQKVLVICAQAETAQDLEQCLRLQHGKRSSVFHEGLSLINRDRAAAYFADDEEGAQVMVCSEIGSEGRNFQFSHHLVLFDLPLNPDLLEQRIGRLDRIGQQHDVHLHVPYYENSAQEVLLRWYQEGLNTFERVFPAGGTIYNTVSEQLQRCLKDAHDASLLNSLIEHTQSLVATASYSLEQGRNRLLELNSCKLSVANELIADLEDGSQSHQLAHFMEKVFDEYGVELQTHSADSIILNHGAEMLENHFPSLPEDGMTATYKRHRALHREDMAFLSWEHPMVLGSLDMITRSDFGNTAFCTLAYDGLAAGTLLLESIFKISVPAPRSLQVGRFLSHSYLRVVVDDKGRDLNRILDEETFNSVVGRIPRITKQELVKQARPMITQLVLEAQKVAEAHQKMIIDTAIEDMHAAMLPEQERLQRLAEVNKAIRPEELTHLKEAQAVLAEALASGQLVLDAVRVAIVTEA
ncbi:MAG: ATP-dependent helicase HepA [Methylophagaceae bacterium]